jgi:hypothetical protein
LVVITSITPVEGASSSLYLPVILKPPICDPAMTLTNGDNQILFGTPGEDHICEYGLGSNVTQYGEGSEGNDTIYQDCRGANTCDQTAILGDGNDTVYQFGGKGDTIQYGAGGTGNQTIIQVGGAGNNTMEAVGGIGYGTIEQYGGQGTNNMKAIGASGDDTIKIYGGNKADTLTYDMTSGNDKVIINAGQGDDTLTINKKGQNFTLFDNTGNVIFKSSDWGSTITLTNTEHIKVIGDDGTIIFQWDAP